MIVQIKLQSKLVEITVQLHHDNNLLIGIEDSYRKQETSNCLLAKNSTKAVYFCGKVCDECQSFPVCYYSWYYRVELWQVLCCQRQAYLPDWQLNIFHQYWNTPNRKETKIWGSSECLFVCCNFGFSLFWGFNFN